MTTAYLLNPYTRTITQHEINPGKLDDIYRLLGCDCVDAVRMANGDAIYVDDNGLYDHPEDPRYFLVDPDGESLNLICGRGLWVGTSPDGDTVSPATAVHDLEKYVRVVIDNEAGNVASALMNAGGVATTQEEYRRMAERQAILVQQIAALATQRFNIVEAG